MDDLLNAVDEAQEPVVEAQSPEEAASEGAGAEGGTPQSEPDEAVAPPRQSPEENHQYARLRRQFEAQLRQEQAQRQQMEQMQRQMVTALNGLGYQGGPEDIADALAAQQQNLTVEQLRAQRQAEQQRARELMRQDPEYLAAKAQAEQYQEMVYRDLYERDVAEINEHFPDAKVKSLDELGEDFAAMRAGGVGNLAAYAAIRQAREAAAKPLPPEIGAVNATEAGEKDYYSPEEADRLTSEQLDNPKIMDIVMKSMTKWK